MRIVIATVQVPFIQGGAESHATNLKKALEDAAHQVDIVSMPFRFYPEKEVLRAMHLWESEEFECLNGYRPDIVICLKFPCYYLKHSHKVVWLIHQFREVYDLWNSDFSEKPVVGKTRLKEEITKLDHQHLSACTKIFANSKNVANRLIKYNKLQSVPLYHPPPLAEHFYWAQPEPYVFYPSRLEVLKRQDLLIMAMKYVKSPTVALIAGKGGQTERLQNLIREMGLGEKVRLVGPKYGEDLLAYYAHCFCVFYGPYDEDYGYITLEAMLAKKPIITCTDSGGPLEFVHDSVSGLVVDPDPLAIAEAIDALATREKKAIEMGVEGYYIYQQLGISWGNVVENLVSC